MVVLLAQLCPVCVLVPVSPLCGMTVLWLHGADDVFAVSAFRPDVPGGQATLASARGKCAVSVYDA